MSQKKEESLWLFFGGFLKTDYRYYAEKARQDNCFDIRRASLSIHGEISSFFHFFLECELQGNDQKKLRDAYGELFFIGNNKLKLGQFKGPFSLENQSKDTTVFFAERSMGNYLSPLRDVGLMLHGDFFGSIVYSAGIFNGDGPDGATKGSWRDEPELSARLVIVPISNTKQSFQIGCSASYDQIDLANVNLEVKSSGMVGTQRNIYVLNSNTKFGVLQEVEKRYRWSLESAWSFGPLALQAEYFNFKYTDLKAVGEIPRDAQFSAWYGSVIYFITEYNRD